MQQTIGNRAFSALVEQAPRPGQALVQRAGEQRAGPAHAQPSPTPYPGLNDRERALSQQYGIRIGPDLGTSEPHFTNNVLKCIDAALRTLPPRHLNENQHLQAIHMKETKGFSESLHNPQTRSIEMARPILMMGIRMPQFAWALLNRGGKLQRDLMDHGVLVNLEGVDRKADRAQGLRKSDRHVMGGTSDALAHGNLIEWTVRHEVGHAADLLASWEPLSHEPRFGGWLTHDGKIHGGLDPVSEAILTHATLSNVNPAGRETAVWTLSSILRSESSDDWPHMENRLQGFMNRYRSYLSPEELSQKGKKLISYVRRAITHPWTFNDGGAGILSVRGRIYQMRNEGTWVSYLADQREYAVSNYQFSSPQEWFAEAYAAYYDSKAAAADRLNPDARDWFAAVLGPRNDQPSASR